LGKFIGLGNFIATLKDPTFWLANLNTLKMLSIQLFICGPFSYLLALLIFERKRSLEDSLK
jgi:ABC-type sugar transport system permease subunit